MKDNIKELNNKDINFILNSIEHKEYKDYLETNTIEKYAVPFGKIKNSDEISSDEKIVLLEKLIKKLDKEQKRISKLSKINDTIENISSYAEILFPIAFVGLLLGLVGTSASLIFDNNLASQIVEKTGYISAAAVTTLGITSIPLQILTQTKGVKLYSKERTLEEIKKVLEDNKQLLINEVENLQVQSLGV